MPSSKLSTVKTNNYCILQNWNTSRMKSAMARHYYKIHWSQDILRQRMISFGFHRLLELISSQNRNLTLCPIVMATMRFFSDLQLISRNDRSPYKTFVIPYKYTNSATKYEGGSESSVIGVITLLIDMIGCCIIH